MDTNRGRKTGRYVAGAVFLAAALIATIAVAAAALTPGSTTRALASVVVVAGWLLGAVAYLAGRNLPVTLAFADDDNARRELAERSLAFPLAGTLVLLPISVALLLQQLERDRNDVDLFLLAMGLPILMVGFRAYRAGRIFAQRARGEEAGEPSAIGDLFLSALVGCIPGLFFFFGPPIFTLFFGLIPVTIAYRWARKTAQRESDVA
jgi:hypothetical protein